MQPDKETEEYFNSIQKEVERAYSLARLAREEGKDPEPKVEIPLAEDLAARVEGLVSTFFPELLGSGLKDAIRVLEEKYGKNDERVALLIGREVAQGKFSKLDSVEKAADAGLRVAVAYLTLGVVTAPLEGISSVKLKENDDKSKYLAVYYAGPIRSAGGTASAISVLAADFIRKGLGIAAYKPTEIEVNRYYAEIEDYYNRVAAKQYHPSKEEISFIIKNVPVEITGDPTEEIEVSNYKDLPRVETNKIRGGMCLVLLDGIPLKAEKILGRVKKYPAEYDLGNWMWLADFVALKKKMHAEKKPELKDGSKAMKYTPSNTYLSKVVAGRPILSHPSRAGGFRLRLGRSRTGGLASTSVHPAAMFLTEFAAVGTQLATEFPGKATVCTPCDSIEPPVVRLRNGSVMELADEKDAIKYRNSVSAILSMGDILVPYGEFISNNHMLLPPGYCEEWWILEAKKGGLDVSAFKSFPPALEESIKLAKGSGIPLHPRYNFFWHDISSDNMKELARWLSSATVGADKILLKKSEASRILERLCAPFTVSGDVITLEGKSLAVFQCLGCPAPDNLDEILSKVSDDVTPAENIFRISGIKVRDRGPTRVGIRMGRPEKAEKRLLKGRPQILFPCGDEGGKMRNLMVSYAGAKITAEFPVFKCASCGEENPYKQCFNCGSQDTERLNVCAECGKRTKEDSHCHRPTKKYARRTINPKKIMDAVFKNLGIHELPKLFKGVRGVSGPDRNIERLEKGVLRTQYDLYVNKDGTTRYDSTDVPITHFKPKEVGVSIGKLKSLGYLNDFNGAPLESAEQVLELKVQDIIISDNNEFSSVDYLISVANFVDDLLVKFYGLTPFYGIKSKEDLAGHLVIGLAPHTSAGIVGRIVGFTPAKICLAHPFWHAGKRRNCDGDEDSVLLLMDALLNFSRKFLPDTRGGRSVAEDTIIYTICDGAIGSPTAKQLIDNQIEQFGAKPENDGFEVCRENPAKIEAVCFNPATRKAERVPIAAFIRHVTDKKMFEIKTTGGKISVTEDHNLFATRGSSIFAVRTSELKQGDCVVGLFNMNLDLGTRLEDRIDLFELLDSKELHVVVPKEELEAIKSAWKKMPRQLRAELSYRWDLYRYLNGQRSAPLAFYKEIGLMPVCRVNLGKGAAIKRHIATGPEFFALLGYMLSEGDNINGEICNTNPAIVADMQRCLECVCGVKPELRTDKRKAKVCYRIRVPKALLAALHALGMVPCKARKKTIPSFVFGASTENKKAFIDAYVKGDGHVYRDKNFTKIFTSSAAMAAQMSLLLHTLQYKTTCHRTRPAMYEVIFSKLNETDPWWPLWDMNKGLYRSLRSAGMRKQQISRTLANYRKNVRTKTASRAGIKKLQGLICDDALHNQLNEICCGDIKVERVISVKEVQYAGKYVYDLEVPKHQNFLCGPHPLFVHNTMDAPLVLTSKLNPEEVDDEAWRVDISPEYPLELYEEACQYKYPSELTKKPRIVADVIKTPEVFHIKFTHDTANVNAGPLRSKYVELGSMMDKVAAQLDLAEKAVAVDKDKSAELIISKHFLRDIKGNLRTFSRQQLRCTNCNAKYRRPPLSGKCKCGSKLQLTVSEGAVRKYLEPTKHIIEKYRISPYLAQQLSLIERDVDELFGKKDRQLGLAKFR